MDNQNKPNYYSHESHGTDRITDFINEGGVLMNKNEGKVQVELILCFVDKTWKTHSFTTTEDEIPFLETLSEEKLINYVPEELLTNLHFVAISNIHHEGDVTIEPVAE